MRFFWKRTIVKRNILGIVLFLAGCMVPAVYGDVRSGGSGAQSPFDLTGGASSDGENVHDSGEIFLYRPGSISTGDDEGPAAVHDLSMKAAGDYVPALQVGEWIKGGPFTLGDGTIYLVEFWATWCPHCANAVSYLTDIQHTYGPRGVRVAAVSWEAVDTVRNYVEARGDAMDYAVAVDDHSATFLAYDAVYDITGVPHVFLVDGEGRFMWRGHPADPALIQQLETMTQPEGEDELEGEGEGEIYEFHPGDMNHDSRMVLGEAIAYLTGWQQDNNDMEYAIRAAYLWQNGEHYTYDSGTAPPLSWILAP